VIGHARSVSLSWSALVIAAVGLLATGAAAAFWWLGAGDGARHTVAAVAKASEQAPSSESAPKGTHDGHHTNMKSGATEQGAIELSAEVVARAGIETEVTRSSTARSHVRIPGTIEPNAYRQVAVTVPVQGRVTTVSAVLGERVSQGQVLAQIYSPTVAEAQSSYLSVQAGFRAADQKLRRLERLADIGAASRQELEQGRAEHMTHAADVESARTRLELLGLSSDRVKRLTMPAQIMATMDVLAPSSGVVISRQANPGLIVEPTTELFTVVDLSTVWAIGSVYERDFERVRVGSPASVTSPASTGSVWQGRVNYIDPQIAPDTRTARIRVEVPNREKRLRLAMYVNIAVEDARTGATTVLTRQAVQTIGNRHFVYLPQQGQPGRFLEREVVLGRVAETEVEVLSGLEPGDVVVSRGSFMLRAERERRGAGPSSTTAVPSASGSMPR